MLIISHRGNVSGPNPSRENSPSFIDEAISNNFIVEVDLWIGTDTVKLGHDFADYDISLGWLMDRRENIIIHAKNLSAVQYLYRKDLHWFYHNNEPVVLTSKGWMWCYPGNYLADGITVQFGKPDLNIPKIHGICTDYPLEFRSKV